jgi:hypothetical protein
MATIFKIHPAIGIARVGDSTSNFYLSPEKTGALPIACDQDGNAIVDKDGNEQTISSFKDRQQRVLRQAARFRVYTYDDAHPAGQEIKIGDQIEVVSQQSGQVQTGTVTDIQWTVYLANKKASWYEFQQLDGEHGYAPDHPLRNADITGADARQRLIIDPGPQTVSHAKPQARTAQFAAGQNPGVAQSFPPPLTPFSISTLGELKATAHNGYNRLIVLGGHGCSGSMKTGFGEPHIATYANNDGWFDDIADGPVTAQISFEILKINGNDVPPDVTTGKVPTSSVPVDASAWVIVGYPRYAPQIVDIITMDDLVYDVAIRYQAYNINIYGVPPFDGSQSPPDRHDLDAVQLWRENATWNPNYYPYFWRDIWPILERPNQYQWVLDFQAFGAGDPHSTGPGRPLDQTALSIPPFHDEKCEDRQTRWGMRQFVYRMFRKPGQENLLAVPPDPSHPKYQPHAMPYLCGDNPLSNVAASKFLRLTDTQLFFLRQWADGKFINEKNESLPDQADPPGVALDRGVLGNVLGGAFCPGAEACWIMRNPAIYAEPYRIKGTALSNLTTGSLSQPAIVTGADDTSDMATGLEPGDITKYSGLPWQADFNECSTQDIDITYEQWNTIYPSSVGDPVKQVPNTTYWWPSHRPMGVNQQIPTPPGSPPQYTLMEWSQGIPQSNAGDLKMVTAWKGLGFIINNAADPNGPAAYIQIERNDANL